MRKRHWESDLMSFQKNSQHMWVCRERISGYVVSERLQNKTAAHTSIAALTPLFSRKIRSITYDNGGEFTHHTRLQEELGVDTYFCDAYASWQKGGVENSNGRLRRDLPRKTDILSMAEEDFSGSHF